MSDITPAELQKMEQDLAKMEQELTKFQNLFEADGFVDTVEQEKLKKMKNAIALISNRISAEKNTTEDGLPPVISTDIFHEYKQSMRTYLNEVQGACRDVKGFIAQAKEDANGNMLFTIFSTVIGSFGVQYAVGIKIIEEALKILKSKPKGSLTEFHMSWLKSLDAVKEDKYLQVAYNDFEDHLREVVVGNRSVDELGENEIIKSIQPFIDSKYPNKDQMRQAYIQAWIDSAKNEPKYPILGKYSPGESDGDAGYICVKTKYIYPMVNNVTLITNPKPNYYKDGHWSDEKIYIDDMPRPKGTIEALIGTYGGSTALEKLPLKMVAYVEAQRHAASSRSYGPDTVSQKYTRARNGNWVMEYGQDQVFAIFKQYIKTKTIKDLKPE